MSKWGIVELVSSVLFVSYWYGYWVGRSRLCKHERAERTGQP